jgi:hypothetical protein
MTLLWILTGASLLLAFAAWARARRLGRRLDQLSEMYWELKYQHGELRAQLQQQTRPGESAPSAGQAPRPTTDTAAREAFVPLTSLRR